nr:hypothetical protein [uncultured Gellertiella sp.]
MASSTPIQLTANLIQGVSQQAIQNRRDAQCEAQFDCVNSVLEGAAARPHADLVKIWAGRVLTGSRFSETSYDITENYLTGVNASGQPFAIDLADGTDCTVINAAPDLSYLTAGSSTPAEKLRAQVVDDYTFIANRGVTPAMAGAVSPAPAREALVFVRATAFAMAYTVSVSGPGGSASYSNTTSNTDVSSTQTIASNIASGLSSGGYAVQQNGSTLRIYRPDGQDFSLYTSDGNGDSYVLGFKGTVPSLSKLPARGFPGMVFKVQGDPKTNSDDFYVKFVGDSATGGWQETVAPSVKTTIDPATMPHALVLTGYRQFTFKRLAYSTRVAGDGVNTAKDPGFIGKRIQDMIYHQRRLGLIHPAGAVFSKTDNPYTYLPDTVQTVLATAPVDLKVSSGDKRGSSILDFGVQASENLFLWAQKSQFRVSSGNDPFKQDTVEVLPAMAYQYAKKSYPLSVGSFLFLMTEAGPYATLRALQFSQGKVSGDPDLTAHVGQYIKSGVRELTASDSLRYVFIQSDGESGVLNLFNYTYEGDQGFVQTGINKWRIPGGEILWCSLKDSTLRVLQQRAEGVAYLRFDLTPQVRDPIAFAEYSTRLDIRVDETRVTGLAYSGASNQTTFTLPYVPSGPDLLVVTSADKAGGYQRGRVFEVLSVVGSVVTMKGDLTGYRFYVGHRITSVRVESEFMVRTDKGVQPFDRLTVNRFFVTMAYTGYSRVEVSTPNKPTSRMEFTGQELGGGARTGPPKPKTGLINIGVNELAHNATISIINDSFLPSYWQSAGYEYAGVGGTGAR